MRPHKVLDDMAEIERRFEKQKLALEEQVDIDLWSAAKQALQRAVTFEFHDLAPTAEHVDFGLDLLDRNMLHLPFPVTFYASKWVGIRHAVVACDGNLIDVPSTVIMVITEARTGNEKGDSFDLPSSICFLAKDKPMEKPAPHYDILKGSQRRRSTGELLDRDGRIQGLGRAMRFVCGAVSMLMSKDVEARSEPSPDKLNRQRLAKGRYPINEVRTVRILADAKRYRDAGASFGTHASPKMHWRRGHFRTLHRGEEGQRVIPVAPSLVGANESARHVVPKEYVVEAVE